MWSIDRIEKDPKLDSIIIVTDINGAQMRYHMGQDGILRPGRVWCSTVPDHAITFFIPFPDGQPEVIKVDHL